MESEMKTLNLKNFTLSHWSPRSLVALGAAFLLTTQPAQGLVQQAGTMGAAKLPQARTGPTISSAARQIQRVPAPACSDAKTDSVRATARAAAPEILIDCSLTLRRPGWFNRRNVITKRLVFDGASASDVIVECNSATINGGPGTFNFDPRFAGFMVEIRSKEVKDPTTGAGTGRWLRPENITLRNCNIIGSVIVYGALDSVPDTITDTVRFIRSSAPRNIVFDHVTITGLGLPCAELSTNCNLLYLHSGVSFFEMRNSEIKGSTSEKAANVYLDDMSFRNTFRNNIIHAATKSREMMAIDGSSENVIINNHFGVSNNGGIHLYRNCGEDNSPRQSTPSSNTIVNNVFFLRHVITTPSIFVASRNGRSTEKTRCPPNFFDNARFNVVMQNQIMPERPSVHDANFLGDLIKVGRPDVNTPNFIKDNEIVDAVTERRAGCHIRDGYPDFVQDGQFVNVFHTGTGEPVCRNFRLTCNDGVPIRSSDVTCQVSDVGQMDFQCFATGNNIACKKTVSVPAGKQIIGAKAVCNLEFGRVSSTDLNGASANFVKVLRASDDVSEGRCTLGRTSIQSGQAVVSGIHGLNSASFECRERDKNGGDCHIRVRLFFR